MRSKLVFMLSGLGLALAIISAAISSQQPQAQPPVFNPAANPFSNGIYATGIVESSQSQGENINIYPEVAGPVARVLVAEGAAVHRGDVLLTIDDTVQQALAEQQHSQAEAAGTLLAELKAEPRPENLAIALAQVENAKASLKNAQDQLAKLERSFALEPRSVSREALDNGRNAASIAATALAVAEKQAALVKAGAWSYEIRNQENQYAAFSKAYAASAALLAKYSIRAPVDGTVLSLQATVGSYVSPQGVLESYSQALGPLIVMGAAGEQLAVRAYIDEILVQRLPEAGRIRAQMFIRSTDIHVPLTFVRVQPIVSPKIELSAQRQERVDLRVLPVIFRFDRPKNLRLYPGQLVDVYVGEN